MFSKIAIIGTGNIGTWWFKLLQKQNNLQVFSFSSRKIIAIPADFDLYIFALKDDVYEEVFKQIPFKMYAAVHTSGSLSQNILAPYSDRFGVFYPYQSVCGELCAVSALVPLCVEGCNFTFEESLFSWANAMFDTVYRVSEKQRFAMHLAAVFANNFTNAMFGIAYDIFKENNLDWSLIFPLLENTLEKAKLNPPHSVQTGPAKRNDINTMQKHCNNLQNEDLKTLYQLISKIIQQQNHKPQTVIDKIGGRSEKQVENKIL
jgi:predicted short-subunit dehydrogenase-like oxidoreductase (DUF2520 family)